MTHTTLVIAHRGASADAAENSLDAFAKAIDVGADMIEFDVRRTADDRLIAFHDADVRGDPVEAMGLSDIEAGTGSRPALLDEILELARDRIKLDVELKEAGYVRRVVDAVREHFDPSELVFTSFLDRVVAEVKDLAPDIRAGLLLGLDRPRSLVRTRVSEIFPVGRARRCNADFIAPHSRIAALGALERASSAGLGRSFVWTLNEDDELLRFLRDPRVGAVITDRPARAVELRAGLGGIGRSALARQPPVRDERAG